jgi:tRNA threonylcarbamoyl adenosine modification protein (Sua5/YciO/YrdC/YwlC family)
VQTRYLSTDPGEAYSSNIRQAAETLRSGGLVIFPTETVYGLGADANSSDALERLHRLKNRPDSQPLTIHLADPEGAVDYADRLSPGSRRLMERYWPGPLTLIIPARGGGTVGLRVPSNEACRDFLRQADTMVVATSANPHGEDPAVDMDQVRAYFDGQVEVVLEGAPTALRQSSTIVRMTGGESGSYEVLRKGIISPEMIQQTLMGRSILFVCTGNTCRSPMAKLLFQKHLAAKLDVPVDDLRELGYVIESAGIFAGLGGNASDNAVATMAEQGCDLSTHRSRPLTAEMVEDADRIYGMSISHAQLLLQISPEAQPRVRLLSDAGISDPIGGDLETYRKCANEIENGVKDILKQF